jgi:predicted esterase
LERENEIFDYVQYLNQLTNTLQLNNYTNAKIILLGFSQGVSTQTRFLSQTALKINFSVMVAGEIGKEFQEDLPENLSQTNSLYLVGNQENIIKPEKTEMHKQIFKNSQCIFKNFDGKHEINESTIQTILAWLEIAS